ncbi:uncharacterized protein LOC112507868 isoform X2 [Cynara cardunculus var. scolymus]|uniref:uncharacterized protein LOC112507868 isoform X2 n=1 Tax=Cynara cardunculus var. scolymus TaxID=59895 RepID=UPI000D62B146|nr:uncharacterized protein LOC112507868 isoform X2 [Cynara cardunculus var. scolymus]
MDADAQGQQNPFSLKQPSSSTCTYFREQAIRGSQSGNFGGGGHVGLGVFGGPSEMREAIQREREKERIRAEIIAEEMARTRILEAEVRKELMMEREMMAMRSGRGFSSPFMSLSMQPNHNNIERRILHQQPIGLEGRIVMSLEEKYPHGGNRLAFRGFEVAPFQRLRDSPKIERIPTPLPEDTKKEVILLTGGSLSGTKRKSAPSVAGDSSKPHSDGSKKKVKEEWSCAICQVSATSERALTEHLQGKKHQSKEAALIAQKSGANFGLGVSPKKPIVKPIKLSLTTVTPSSSEKKSKKRKESRKETSSSSEVKKEDRRKKSEKYKFWCEMCEVGAFSEKVMNHHKKGKKHLTQLAKLLQKGKVEESKTRKAVVGDDAREEKQDDGSSSVVVNEGKQDDDSSSVVVVVVEDREKSEVKEDASIHLMGL